MELYRLRVCVHLFLLTMNMGERGVQTNGTDGWRNTNTHQTLVYHLSSSPAKHNEVQASIHPGKEKLQQHNKNPSSENRVSCLPPTRREAERKEANELLMCVYHFTAIYVHSSLPSSLHHNSLRVECVYFFRECSRGSWAGFAAFPLPSLIINERF